MEKWDLVRKFLKDDITKKLADINAELVILQSYYLLENPDSYTIPVAVKSNFNDEGKMVISLNMDRL